MHIAILMTIFCWGYLVAAGRAQAGQPVIGQSDESAAGRQAHARRTGNSFGRLQYTENSTGEASPRAAGAPKVRFAWESIPLILY
jgi:hypothetical protein